MIVVADNVRLLALKDRILARSSKRKQNNIQALWLLLVRMHSQGIRVFTVSTVGRASERSGGVKLQSMMNKGGADYRELITAFAEEVGGAQPSLGQGSSPLEQAIEAIPDLDIRTRLRMVLSKAKRLEADNDRLREALRQSHASAESRLHPCVPDGHTSLPTNPAAMPVIDADAMMILERFVSDDWIDERRWNVDRHGTIHDEFGERITPVAFVKEMRRLISAMAGQPSTGNCPLPGLEPY
jgi:hypothetical protein